MNIIYISYNMYAASAMKTTVLH